MDELTVCGNLPIIDARDTVLDGGGIDRAGNSLWGDVAGRRGGCTSTLRLNNLLDTRRGLCIIPQQLIKRNTATEVTSICVQNRLVNSDPP